MIHNKFVSYCIRFVLPIERTIAMNLSQMQYYKQQYGYSYDRLSQLTGIPKGTIQKIFTGVTKSPRYETLQALERVLKPENPPKAAESTKGLYMESRQSGADAGVNQADRVCETAVPYGQKKQGEYTLEDYYALPEDKRYELIDGVLYEMTAPTTVHQIIALQMCHQIESFIDEHGGNCMSYIAPVDVQLDCDDKTMVEPDVIILCDRSKDINRCIYGAPDFVAEVLSKSTRRKDIGVKTYKYANAGVREYWMIDPKDMKVIVYTFAQNDDAEDTVSIFGFQDKIPVGIYNGELKIDFAKISKRLEANN